MTEAGKRLLVAAHEALVFAKGEAKPGTYIVHAPPPAVDVKAIRGRLKMTQVEFGARFGFGKARIRDWEQHRTRPAASDRVLLVTIDADPNSVLRALELYDVELKKAQPVGASIKRGSGVRTRKASSERFVTIPKAPAAKSKARPSARKGAAG